MLHDLALELGMTVRELSLRMTTRELGRWSTYSQTVGLPTRRIQLQLAFNALVSARLAGNDADTTVDDFYIRLTPRKKRSPGPAVVSETVAAEAIAGIGGRRVRVLGQGRKKKKE